MVLSPRRTHAAPPRPARHRNRWHTVKDMNCMDLDGIPSPDRLANNIDAKHLRQIIAEAYTPSVL